jgi:hypothetical protein
MIETTNLFCEMHIFESLVASRQITQSHSRRSSGTVETKIRKTESCFNCVNIVYQQGRSQGVTGVTVVMGPRAQGGPKRAPEGSPGGPGTVPERKWPGKGL